MSNIKEILSNFPKRIEKEIETQLSNQVNKEGVSLLEEIRIRSAKPVILKYTDTEQVIENLLVTPEEILEILQSICQNSIYSYQYQICKGYLTLKGGHRVRNYRKCCINRGKNY